jgi:hypothetical protein
MRRSISGAPSALHSPEPPLTPRQDSLYDGSRASPNRQRSGTVASGVVTGGRLLIVCRGMSQTQVREPVSAVVGARNEKWVYGVVLVPPVAAVLTVLLAPDPHGHWSEHLWSAYFGMAQLVVLAILAFMLGWRTLSVLLWVSLAVIAVGIVYETIGNLHVADSIWGTRGNPGFGDGYTQGHERAETGDLLVLVGGAAFAFVVGLTRRVPLKLAGLALLMGIIPPWIWPATGVLMLLVYGLTSEGGLDRRRVEQASSAAKSESGWRAAR